MKAIEVKQLTKRFGTFTAVDHISFEVEPGEIFGFLGANLDCLFLCRSRHPARPG